jgi:L-methionine (R)-S-oxide reductase
MFTLTENQHTTKPALYADLASQVQALLTGERNAIANAANVASLIWHTVPDLNWAGFYLFDGTELVLGPFMGKPACVRIQLSRGVCGAAARTRTTQLVLNVHDFPGHIACDSASNSEVVVPLVKEDRLIGVLDIDSPLIARFDADDQTGFEQLAQIYLAASDC